MATYQTSAKVADHGEVRVSGVPFAPGTEVEVTVSPARTSAQVRDRAARLFAALDAARHTEPVGALRREELYDRGAWSIPSRAAPRPENPCCRTAANKAD
jgi:hypothetical protein